MSAQLRAVLGFVGRHGIALAAIFVAIGGTATASHLVVRASDIQRNAVRAKHIKKDSIRLKQLHRNKVSRAFGSGVLGGQVEGFTLPAGLGGDDSRSPIGVSHNVADSHDIVAPRRLVIRDVAADAVAPVVRRINLRLRRLPGGQVVGCTIELGERSCHSGAARLIVPRGSRIDVWIGDAGPQQVELTDNTYRFAYRVAP